MPQPPLIQQHTLRVEQDEVQSRFSLFDGDDFIGFIQYEQDGDVLSFIHTIIKEEFSRRGYARALTTIAFERMWALGLKVNPVCTYTVDYLEKHPQYAVLRAQ